MGQKSTALPWIIGTVLFLIVAYLWISAPSTTEVMNSVAQRGNSDEFQSLSTEFQVYARAYDDELANMNAVIEKVNLVPAGSPEERMIALAPVIREYVTNYKQYQAVAQTFKDFLHQKGDRLTALLSAESKSIIPETQLLIRKNDAYYEDVLIQLNNEIDELESNIEARSGLQQELITELGSLLASVIF